MVFLRRALARWRKDGSIGPRLGLQHAAWTLPLLVLASITAQAAAAQAAADVGWTRHGLDAAETRYSRLAQVNADNVHRLEAAWSWEIPKRSERIETTPLIVDGVLYATGPWSYVFAVDAATGAVIWTWDPEIAPKADGRPTSCCGEVNRGVAVADDKVFVGLIDGRLVALDRIGGFVRWSVRTTPADSDYAITGAPRVIGNRVVIGNSGADFGVRGYVGAYEAETGLPLWRTYTVPGDPALGYEDEAMAEAAKTWNGEWWKTGGGGTVWDAIAHDVEAGLVYVGTGNGSPWSRDHRSPGGGDNLYLSSILALNAEDGKVVWHYQTTPGDDWDYASTQHLMLLDLEMRGQSRKAVVQAPKNGFFYVLDRLTGELLTAEPFADDMTWATHVDMATGRPVETPRARYGTAGGTYLSPGTSGAHNWPPMSWNAGTGLVYVPAQNSTAYYEKARHFVYTPGGWNTGTTTGMRLWRRRPGRRGPAKLLLAWDPATNREAWRVPAQEGAIHGGTMSTAGRLVFWSTGSRLAALDARTGDELWTFEIGPSPGPPVTYAIDGRQYVAVASGRWNSDLPFKVWAFTLDGEAEPRR